MKHLYLMRHAKAEDGFGKRDFDRDLIDKGSQRIAQAAYFCKQQKGVAADIMLASSAHRTQQTAEAMLSAMGWSAQLLHLDASLYLGTEAHILHVLYALDDEVQHAWVVAHNPGISDLAYALDSRLSTWLPTAGIVALRFRIRHWHELSQAKNTHLFSFLGAKRMGAFR